VPEFNEVQQWALKHPRMVKGLGVAMVALAILNLYNAIGLAGKLREALGELQKAASEAMGG